MGKIKIGYGVCVMVICTATAGCAEMSTAVPILGPLAIADTTALVASKKSISDRIVSWKRGKNCSTIRIVKGLHYCEEDEPQDKEPPYCYRTLGKVTCHDVADPRRRSDQRLGGDPAALIPVQNN